jgi:hypothetical protein
VPAITDEKGPGAHLIASSSIIVSSLVETSRLTFLLTLSQDNRVPNCLQGLTCYTADASWVAAVRHEEKSD